MTNNTVLAIVHQKTSQTGRIGAKLEARGYAIEMRCPMLGHGLPERLDDYAAVLVMGGPMSANDDHLLGIRAELDWLPVVLGAAKPYLGVCLGAQLLARALGARVSPHDEGLTEVGYFPVYATPAGRALFGDSLMVYHWHREGFELPAGAQLLARGERFPRQAFRYGVNAYGIQFHPEITPAIMERWLGNCGAELAWPGAHPAEAHRSGHRQYNALLDRWVDGFLDQWLGAAPLRANEGNVDRCWREELNVNWREAMLPA